MSLVIHDGSFHRKIHKNLIVLCDYWQWFGWNWIILNLSSIMSQLIEVHKRMIHTIPIHNSSIRTKMSHLWGFPCGWCMHNRYILNQIQIFSRVWNISLFPHILKYDVISICNDRIHVWINFTFTVHSSWTVFPQTFSTCNGFLICVIELTEFSKNGMAVCERGIV